MHTTPSLPPGSGCCSGEGWWQRSGSRDLNLGWLAEPEYAANAVLGSVAQQPTEWWLLPGAWAHAGSLRRGALLRCTS
jgi:hypothetical protein